jgi:hypothetical protein
MRMIFDSQGWRDDEFRHRGQFSHIRDFGNYGNCDDKDGDVDSIKLKILSFQGKNNLKAYLEWEKKMY